MDARALRLLHIQEPNDFFGLTVESVYDIFSQCNFGGKCSIRALVTRLGLGDQPNWVGLWKWRPLKPQLREIVSMANLKGTTRPTELNNRTAVMMAMSCLGIENLDGMRSMSIDVLRTHVAQEKNLKTRNRLLCGVNIMLRAVGRQERLHVHNLYDELTLFPTKEEGEWMEKHGKPEWYQIFKTRLQSWIQSHPVLGGLARTTKRVRFSRMCKLVREAGDLPTTPVQINDALIVCIVNGVTNNPHSLVGMKRGHRSGKGFDPFKGTLNEFHISAQLLLEFLDISDKALINRKDLHRRLQNMNTLPDNSLLISPVDDALTGIEMENTLSACKDERETLILTLLARLGMRLGAIANLRTNGCWNRWQLFDNVLLVLWKDLIPLSQTSTSGS